MWPTILIGLVVLILILVVFIATRPAEFRISRSTRMNATPLDVFAQVNDFHKWQEWSPWAELDPNAKATFSGAESGVGAGFAWAGNKEVGEGSMAITESRPGEVVRIRLDFLKPMKATNTAEFTFTPDGDQTVVTWSMFGTNNFMGKAVNLVIDCEKMVGDQFDKGLASMKAIVETPKP